MKSARPLFLVAAVLAAACSENGVVQPALDDIDVALAKTNARAQCRASVLAPGANSGTISTDDCVFNNGTTDQYEDLYLIPQGRFGTADGNQMLTLRLEAETFNWIYGFGGHTGEIFPSPVYGFRSGPAGVYTFPNGFINNTFSVIGGEPTYKLWVGGQNTSAVGAYTLTATTEPTANICVKNHRVYLQGDVSFSGSISNETSCRGTVQFGPHVGAPLNYQYWWIRVSAGDVITLGVTGVDEPTLAAAIIDFGLNQASLDLGDGAGDSDRFVSFTAQRRADIYVEVSSKPDVVDAYTVTVNGPDTK